MYAVHEDVWMHGYGDLHGDTQHRTVGSFVLMNDYFKNKNDNNNTNLWRWCKWESDFRVEFPRILLRICFLRSPSYKQWAKEKGNATKEQTLRNVYFSHALNIQWDSSVETQIERWVYFIHTWYTFPSSPIKTKLTSIAF